MLQISGWCEMGAQRKRALHPARATGNGHRITGNDRRAQPFLPHSLCQCRQRPAFRWPSQSCNAARPVTGSPSALRHPQTHALVGHRWPGQIQSGGVVVRGVLPSRKMDDKIIRSHDTGPGHRASSTQQGAMTPGGDQCSQGIDAMWPRWQLGFCSARGALWHRAS